METRVRAKSTVAALAVLLATAVLAVLTGLKTGIVPAVAAKVILTVTIPLFFVTSFLAIRDASRLDDASSAFALRPAPAVEEQHLQRPSETERVRAWRNARLTSLGIAEETALILAEYPAFSVHELERLLEAGCPLGTALRILWPS